MSIVRVWNYIPCGFRLPLYLGANGVPLGLCDLHVFAQLSLESNNEYEGWGSNGVVIDVYHDNNEGPCTMLNEDSLVNCALLEFEAYYEDVDQLLVPTSTTLF